MVRRVDLAALVLLGSGCATASESLPEEPADLIEPERWAVADPAGDLFADQRPPDVECDEEQGYYLEPNAGDVVFEISTTWCNYVTVSQSSLATVAAGQEIEIRVWHYPTTTPDDQPAQAYLGLGLDDRIVWETRVDLPGPGGWIEDVVVMSDDIPEGSDLQFHVHNHGMNAWQIVSLRRL